MKLPQYLKHWRAQLPRTCRQVIGITLLVSDIRISNNFIWLNQNYEIETRAMEDDTIAETKAMRRAQWWENGRERDNSEDLRIDVRKILKWILKEKVRMVWSVLCGTVRDRRQAVVSWVRKYGVPQNVGDRSISWRTISFSRRLCYMELVGQLEGISKHLQSQIAKNLLSRTRVDKRGRAHGKTDT